jgi:acyl-CoA thioesterase-1
MLWLLGPAACEPAGAPGAPTTQRWAVEPLVAADQVGLPGADVVAPSVLVTDSAGSPARQVRVAFTVRSGDGSVGAAEARTDADGRAWAVQWTLGQRLGLQQVRVSLVDEPLVRIDFNATAIPLHGPLRMDGQCAAPDSLDPVAWTLPKSAARVAVRQPLTVVAIGSSSTVGVGASVPDSAYPALLARHLARLYPASPVTVYNAGRGAQDLAQLQARFASDVASRSPQLVILQTGSVDAMNGADPDAFEARLRDAVASLQGLGADVVLLDSQRYPGVGESAGYRTIQARMRRVADDLGLPLVRRYELMTWWLQSGTYAYSQVLSADQLHPSDLTYSCTARQLAEGVARAVVRSSAP